MSRHDGRAVDELRPIKVQRGFTKATAGSVLISAGDTVILCTASLENSVPPWRRPRSEDEQAQGWVTAEYNMLPGSTSPRKQRDRKKVDGRTTEIQRLVGRSLRAAVDFAALGEHTIQVDCDVLQADGGTRTLSITGGFIALCDAVHKIGSDQQVITDSVTAVSVGVVDGRPVLDLDYPEDSTAEVDMNVVMTGSGRFIEVQGTAEGEPFDFETLQAQLTLAQNGIAQLTRIQQESLAEAWPL
ncbi:MAG TPA: ribonuclease PH [Planctomycetaceae bacterium]|nr:ribonuclease PH [Planctomycetaceae bacterium]